MPQCKFKRADGFNCGSFAFNLQREGITQEFCDVHHWQTEVKRLRAEKATLIAERDAIRADAERLRAALEQIATAPLGMPSTIAHARQLLGFQHAARRALEGGE